MAITAKRLAFSLVFLIIRLGGSSSHAFFVPPLDTSDGVASSSIACQEPQQVDDATVASESRPVLQVQLFESILRDGEQGARRTLLPEQKGLIARRLEKELGMTIIDAGFPAASPLDFGGVQAVASDTDRAVVSALSYGTPSEIGVAAQALRRARDQSRIATFHRPMEISSRYMTSGDGDNDGDMRIRQKLLRQARRAVEAASDLAPEVQYYLVYAGNRDPTFLAELAQTASFAGASHVVLADSQSSMTPTSAFHLTKRIKHAVSPETIVAAHFHNQMGLALPNTLASIRGGATQVESCLLGVGDAGGNLATEQFLAYCNHCRNMMGRRPSEEEDDELFPLCSTSNGCPLPASVSLAEDVARMIDFCIGENQPIVGERVFTCTTGIHQDNFQHLGHTSFAPDMAGRSWRIALNRHSSRKSVRVLVREHLQQDRSSGDIDVVHEEGLVDAAYSYLSHQLGEVDSTAIIVYCDTILKAYSALRNDGVVICPTTVGYTLVSTKDGAKR